MLDLAQLSRHRLRREPFEWAFIDEVFESRATAEELRDALPGGGFTERDPSSGASTEIVKGIYKGQTLVEGSELTAAARALPDVWKKLVEQLASHEYLAAMGKLTGRNLRECPVDVRLSKNGPEHWLEPHPDNERNIATHLMYFNEPWEKEWGGCLRILRSDDMDDVAYEIPPLLNTSVVLVRSDDSWHAVPPLKKDVGQERYRFFTRIRVPE